MFAPEIGISVAKIVASALSPTAIPSLSLLLAFEPSPPLGRVKLAIPKAICLEVPVTFGTLTRQSALPATKADTL